jgi:hypothetical protein
MDDPLRDRCHKIMATLLSHHSSDVFKNPVDPVLDECPDYLTIVRFPMDLTTISRNLDENKYSTIQQWKNDVQLVWSNAVLYHGANSLLGLLARDFEILFHRVTEGFSDSVTHDWYTMLDLLSEEFSAEVKILSAAAPSLKRRSSSLMSASASFSDRLEGEWAWDEIEALGNGIRKIRKKKNILRLLECLRSMEPQLVGNKRKLDVNLCELSTATLLALKEELDAIPRREGDSEELSE